MLNAGRGKYALPFPIFKFLGDMIIRKILLQKDEPAGQGVLWLKPDGDDVTAMVFNHGKWTTITSKYECTANETVEEEDGQ